MNWWQYLALVNVYLLLFYGFYALLLSRERFFQLNRIYLVSAAFLSLIIPGIQSNWVKSLFITQKVQYTMYSNPVLSYHFKQEQESHFTIGEFVTLFYLTGLALLLARFAWQLISLNRVIRKQQSPVPYTFFKKITLGENQKHLAVISAHENAHARQWHSLDVLIMEALVILNWFNPIVYLYRLATRHIHEFIADRQALETGINKADYALILLSQTFDTPTHELATGFFNKSLLKQRITMLQKSKSRRVALIKYFLSAPLFMLMLILSSATVDTKKTLLLIDKKVRLELSMQSSVLTTPTAKRRADSLWQIATADPPESATPVLNPVKRVRDNNNMIFRSVEQVPEFPGGLNAFGKFLGTNIKYPGVARQKSIQGRVIIGFIVEEDGTLDNFKIQRGLGYGLDEEAIRVLALSPKWKPGIQNKIPVRVAYSVPINFTLSDESPAPTGRSKAVTGNGIINRQAMADTGKAKTTNPVLGRAGDTGHAPLYIIDGVERENFVNLNPKDIKSITVLKNKSATAIYGDKSAYGVIVVITKNSKTSASPNLFIKN
jgi:TonB family protein